MVKPETFGHLHLVYHFTVPLRMKYIVFSYPSTSASTLCPPPYRAINNLSVYLSPILNRNYPNQNNLMIPTYLPASRLTSKIHMGG